MVVAVGEFGRTPRLSTNSNGQAHTALIAGGGLKTDQVVGATNERAEHPPESPYTSQDLLATVHRRPGAEIHWPHRPPGPSATRGSRSANWSAPLSSEQFLSEFTFTA